MKIIFLVFLSSIFASSLWREDSKNIFVDARPKSIGERVCVLIYESAIAEGEFATERKKDASFGFEGEGLTRILKSEAKGESSLAGSGRTHRAGKLIAKVTAKIISITKNGYLEIYGKKTIKINQEETVINVYGLADPRDISPDGSISSDKLIDAKITYEGRLKLTERPGFFTRIIQGIIRLIF